MSSTLSDTTPDTSTATVTGTPPGRTRPGLLPYALLVPAVLALTVALGYPLVRQVVLSLQDYGLAQQFGQPPEWVGANNYRRLVADGYLWRVTLRSIAFCLVNAALTMAIGVGLALLMRHMSRGVRLLVQTGLLLAWAMPVVASLTVWQWLFDTQYGVVNHVLTGLGLDYEGHGWLLKPLSFFFVATVIVVWMSVPFVALSIYAGLTQVSTEVLEAAALDGASGLQRLRHIIAPIIAPVLSIVMLLQLIWDLRVFTQIKLLQDAGGVTNETNLLGTYVYQLGTGQGDFGTASAVSILILVLTIALSWSYVRSLMKEDA
jgi:N,N'-diacetylchitobiose transport system permease protein